MSRRKKKHIPEEFAGLHKTGTSLGAGSCLWGHQGHHTENSCCYRTQAHNQALGADRPIYHRYYGLFGTRDVPIPTSAYPTDGGGMFPGYYISILPVPRDGDWDVDGPKRDDLKRDRFPNPKKNETKVQTRTVKPGENFYSDSVPYWNNAHHLIPKGTLVAKIDAETDGHPYMGSFIKKSLLKSGYNVNAQENMMFLAQDLEVAKILGMPRHITLNHEDGHDGEKEFADHKYYNVFVIKKLKDIIDAFKAQAPVLADGKHPDEISNLAIEKLKELSKELRRLIVEATSGDAAKAAKAGLPLSTIFGAM